MKQKQRFQVDSTEMYENVETMNETMEHDGTMKRRTTILNIQIFGVLGTSPAAPLPTPLLLLSC